MANMITAKMAAEKWNLTTNRITQYCRDGQIKGAEKIGKSWVIPVDAERPLDGRRKKEKYLINSEETKKPLPIGISEYSVASTQYYYIDKTLMIKDFLDERPMVSLFTRPRRFGKTLNMDMLRVFFEKSDVDTSIFFQDKMIWSYGEKYQKHQGKYPVIFISFKDIKCDTWDKTFEMLKAVIGREYDRHNEIAFSEQCSISDKKYYTDAVEQSLNEVGLSRALDVLSNMLFQHYGTKAIIIIDEYDVPIQQGHTKGFYNEVIDFMRNLFSGGLKDNNCLAYGFLTGILRVAKESIFSGLNNLVIHSVIDDKYSRYFGFTRQEVEAMAQYYHAFDKINEIEEWYGGYRFGDTEIYNPWSVINYFGYGCKPRAFWQSTGSNDVISEVIENADEDIYERLERLLQGKKFTALIDTGVIYPQIKRDPSSIYSFLLVAGYLKAENVTISTNGDFMCEVSLPNKEIKSVYNKEVLQKLDRIVVQSSAIGIQEAIYTNDANQLKKYLRKLLLQSVSSFDTSKELFYHGLLLGICAMFDDKYYISSNRESGEGRFDIQLEPKTPNRPGIIIELKHEKNCSAKQLAELSATALMQIDEKKYDTDMRVRGVKTIIKYGVAFSGKNVEISAVE